MTQYPPPQEELDRYHHMFEQHEAFMKNRCPSVFGRESIIRQVITSSNY